LKTLIVFDFDGTLTDIWQGPFTENYQRDLILLLIRTVDQKAVEQALQEAKKKIAANPDKYGWLYQGKIVAPANADPYLLMNTAASLVFDSFDIFRSPDDRKCVLDFLFFENYAASPTKFRPEAPAILNQLLKDPESIVRFVTNSNTDEVVSRLICTLNLDLIENLHGLVIGSAKKNVIGSEPASTPETFAIPGLERFVYPRRSNYYRVLAELCKQLKVSWQNMVVVGDSLELDLLLPFLLGASVILVANGHTPKYEIEFINAQPKRGRVVNFLSEIVD